LATGSHHSPFWQLSGSAEPIAGATSDKAAIGARAAVMIVERQTIFLMASACPKQRILKPMEWCAPRFSVRDMPRGHGLNLYYAPVSYYHV